MHALLMALSAAAAPPTIVVIAPRTEKELAECLARKCGVREDAIASIHHAQAQFAQGAYTDARKTLLASLRRNRTAAGQDPRAVSALWHALARVTLHNGDMDEYRRASLRAGSILARSNSVSLAEQVRGEVETADALSVTGDTEGAVRRYLKVAEAARARGDAELAQLMNLRSIYARSGLDGRPAARRALEKAARNAALTPRARTVALALAAQLQEGRGAKAGALLDEVPVQAADAPPMLLWAPKDRFTEQREAINRGLANNDPTLLNLLQPRASDALGYGWIDIGFWIRPNGRVEEAEVLRGKGGEAWATDMLKAIQRRRYAPYRAELGSEGRYKIERVTLTYDHMTPVGSLIRRRSGLPHYRFEDLKIEQDAQERTEP